MRTFVFAAVLFICWPVAAAVDGDFDGDGAVEWPDLLRFSADWLASGPAIADPNTDLDNSGVVNMNDFAALSRQWWVGHDNAAPTATAVQATCYPGGSVGLTLAGRDPEQRPLTYHVDPPAQGVLVRHSATDYTYYAHQTAAGSDVFEYTVSDGALTSAPADVNVIVTAPVLDTIAFAGRAGVVIPDDTSISIDDSMTVAFWFRTRWPEGVLFAKRDGGGGLVIGIEGGCVAASLYGQDNTRYSLRGRTAINNGHWTFLACTYNAAGSVLYNGDPNVTAYLYVANTMGTDDTLDDLQDDFEDLVTAIVPAIDLSNSAPVVFGRYGGRMFYGAIDNFANYATALSDFSAALVRIEKRRGASHALSPSYYRRFLYDEGAGLTVWDVSGTVEGAVGNHGRAIWADESHTLDDRWRQRSRLRGVDGARMLPNYRTNE